MSSSSIDSACTTAAPTGVTGLYCLTRRESAGLVVVAMSGFVSLAAVVWVFVLILKNVHRVRKLHGDGDSEGRRRTRLIKQAMDVYMLSLFAAAFFQALGVITEVRWIYDGIVRVGPLCTAQGVMQSLGQAATAMTSLIITLHTFAVIWWPGGLGQSLWSLRVAVVLIATVWLFLILFIAISASVHQNPPFYVPTPYWCWISNRYNNYRIAGENVWLWLALAASLLYFPLIFWSQGYVTPTQGVWWRFHMHSRRDMGDPRRQGRVSRAMIMHVSCALAYFLPVLPTSLARWFLLTHHDVKPFANSEAQFSVKTIFSLCGLVDVLVFLGVRQGVLLFEKKATVVPDTGPMMSRTSLGAEVPIAGVAGSAASTRSGEDVTEQRRS